MAGPAAICIEAVRQRPLEIAGLKVFSSLQGPAGERRTIYREACVAVIAIAIDIGTMTTGTPDATQSLRPTAPRIVDVAAIGKKAPLSPLSILAGTASRHAGRVRRRASTLPSVVGNC